MHIVHLALLPDAIVSTLLDWSDDRRFWDASSRDARLSMMWSSYKEWTENQRFGFQDRATRKLFTTRVLQPETTSYTEISQKILSATAARYMVHWLCNLAVQFCQWTGDEADMKLNFTDLMNLFCQAEPKSQIMMLYDVGSGEDDFFLVP